MYCTKCGAELVDDAKFCINCGCSLSNISLASESESDINNVQNNGQNQCDQHLAKQKPIQINERNITNSSQKKKTTKIIISMVITGCIALSIFAVILVTTIIPNLRYQKALELHENGDPYKAAVILEKLGNFKDSRQLTADYYFEAEEYYSAANAYRWIREDSENNAYRYALCYFLEGKYQEAINYFNDIISYSDAKEYVIKCQLSLMDAAEINHEVTFGVYEQDNDIENGKEEIDWIVINKEGSKVLLMSKNILDYQPFNTDGLVSTGAISKEETYIPWSESYVRTFLNNDFYDTAFIDEEKKYIVRSNITTTDCDEYTYSTQDNVFILSSDEFYTLKEKFTVGTCLQKATEYAKSKNGCNSCYTRDQQHYRGVFGISSVYSPGVIDKHNTVYFVSASTETGAIRPCIWVDISSIQKEGND